MTRHISIYGISNHLGFNRLSVDVVAEDGKLIDTHRAESQTESFEQLYVSGGRRALRYFRRTYGITEVSKPVSLRL